MAKLFHINVYVIINVAIPLVAMDVKILHVRTFGVIKLRTKKLKLYIQNIIMCFILEQNVQ